MHRSYTVTCPWDGYEWDPGYRRATRVDPSYEECPECPRCGMGIEEAIDAVQQRHEAQGEDGDAARDEQALER